MRNPFVTFALKSDGSISNMRPKNKNQTMFVSVIHRRTKAYHCTKSRIPARQRFRIQIAPTGYNGRLRNRL